MKFISPLVLFLFCASYSFGATKISRVKTPSPTPKEVMIPLIGTQQSISVEDFLKLDSKTYRSMTGKKMTLNQRIDLAVEKRLLKRMIRKDGTLDTERMKRTGFFGGWHWHWGGFALGFFLSLLGPIVALFFNDDYKWDRFWTALHTSVWLGVIVLAIAAAAMGGA